MILSKRLLALVLCLATVFCCSFAAVPVSAEEVTENYNLVLSDVAKDKASFFEKLNRWLSNLFSFFAGDPDFDMIVTDIKVRNANDASQELRIEKTGVNIASLINVRVSPSSDKLKYWNRNYNYHWYKSSADTLFYPGANMVKMADTGEGGTVKYEQEHAYENAVIKVPKGSQYYVLVVTSKDGMFSDYLKVFIKEA
ncbi:MAG: hypothetical protein K6B52_03510 [Clostridiales bacterium]|nr:hypothetical protein [Clostridiales bacterium]